MALKVGARGHIAPFIVMDVLRAANERQAAGADVLHLEIGQPGTPAPAAVRAAAKRAIDEQAIGYTDALGLPALRRRIARHYAETYGVEVDPARVAVTPGSSGGFLLAFLAAFDPGDRVALAAPGYPAYRNILGALGLEPVLLEAGPAERYQPTPALLERAGPLAGVIVASPSNPTGTMLGEAEMAALADWCGQAGVRLVSDEIYHGIGYGSRAVTALERDDRAIVVNSFSKYYSMTGWRLGWLVLPEELARPVECLGQNLFISAQSVSQYAGIAAFDCTEELDGYVAGYARNRALLLERLPAAGLDRLAPADGAFYLYADVGHLTNDSQAFCRRLLAETGVAITPGIDFDPGRGSRTVRLSFAGPEGEVAQAAERLADWLRRNR
ncbi:MAG: aminotransferase class I/II-fold pyridoxal phosphate-dependent enzyme [Tistlia sp.]|uniref:aminotransferase class I/II-fold pyridoxal phosphate-dependent enzyme n=1 Tax=Tistlia sp. TaxID=3057121 RepID=UPI0034A4A4EA